MTAIPVPSTESASTTGQTSTLDDAKSVARRVSILEKPTLTSDSAGYVTQGQLTAGLNTRAPAGLSNIAVLDFPSIAAGGTQALTITVTGAVVGDTVALGPPAAIEGGLMWAGRVSSADTVTIRVHNTTLAPIDPVPATWKASIIP